VDSESVHIEIFRLNESSHREPEEYNAQNENIALADIYAGIKFGNG